jgi:hypothetical protein
MRFEPEISTSRTRRFSPFTGLVILIVVGMIGVFLMPSRRTKVKAEAKQKIERDYPLTTKDVEGKLAPVSYKINGSRKPTAGNLNAYCIWDASSSTGVISDLRNPGYYEPNSFLVVVTSTNSGVAYEWSIIFYAFAIQKKDLTIVLEWASYLPTISTTTKSYGKAIHDKYAGLDPKIKQQAEQLLIQNRPLASTFGKSEVYFQDLWKNGYRLIGSMGIHSLGDNYNKVEPLDIY